MCNLSEISNVYKINLLLSKALPVNCILTKTVSRSGLGILSFGNSKYFVPKVTSYAQHGYCVMFYESLTSLSHTKLFFKKFIRHTVLSFSLLLHALETFKA